MAKTKLTPARFAEIEGTLRKQLKVDLEKDIEDCALPELTTAETTDLWSTPKVDSKTVVKLSPTVKKLTGWRLDPRWIQKGGYPTIEQAVEHVVAQIKRHCVADTMITETKEAAVAT